MKSLIQPHQRVLLSGRSIQMLLRCQHNNDPQQHETRHRGAMRRRTLTAHGTLPFGRILLDPFHDAMLSAWSAEGSRVRTDKSSETHHVEVVSAFPRHCTASDGQHEASLAAMPRSSSLMKINGGWMLNLQRLQSSPGYLHVGHVPSNWTWQIPQTSSSGRSHRQVATAFHFLMETFIVVVSVCISAEQRSTSVVREVE
jgi:hypothetical protein